MGGVGRISLQIFDPLSLINTIQINLISVRSISLDSTFKLEFLTLYRSEPVCEKSVHSDSAKNNFLYNYEKKSK
jgi:hypothetical protein